MSEERITAVTMPKWGMSMVTGKVTGWLGEEGEKLGQGDEVIEIETDKIAGVVETTSAGILSRQVARVGDTLPIGALLGVITAADVGDEEIDAFVGEFQDNYTPPEVDAAAAASPTEIFEFDGQRINYLDMGESDEDEAVVLIHGFGGDMNSWLFNQTALAEGRRVLALDLPGHGQSSRDVGDGSLAALGGPIAALVAEKGITRVHWVGHSLGGGVASHLALSAPDKTASLTLVAAAGLGGEINADHITAFIAAEKRRDMKPALQRLFGDPDLVTRDMLNEVLKYKRIEGVNAALVTIAAAMLKDGAQAVVNRAALAEQAFPILVIWGDRDQIIPPDQAHALGDRAAVHVISGAGHMVQMEAAGEVNKLIGEFLA